jgi:hypothetical protein
MAVSTDDSNTNPLSGFFWANNPNVNQQLRQRIALQMMSSGKGKGYPKNIGEGLSAIGDSLGDIGLARMMERGDLGQQAAAQRDAAALQGGDQPPPSYAPPSDTPPAPAVSAIDRAIAPAAAQQPGPPLSAEEQKAGVSPGDYNVLDAQTNLGFKPTPGYMQDAIAAKEKDPDMQAYYGQLSGKEAKNAQDVSPTGAAGPFQITKSTGRGLGLTPGQRFDPAASTDAVRQLTEQNAAVFEKVNGRPPTFQELALMHQQGGMTGSRMVAGTGNAPPRNLAVNNISPGAGPQQAVAGINKYYGMPNATAPVGRDAVAAQLVAQPQPPPQRPPQAPPGPPGGPLPNPTLAGATPPLPATFQPPPSPSGQGPGSLPDQRLALAGPPMPPGNAVDIRTAPPLPSGLRPMPQLAQNVPPQPTPTPGYVMPEPAQPAAPPIVPLSPLGQRALATLNANPNNEYYKTGAVGQLYANEAAKQKLQQDQLNEAYKKQIETQAAMQMERQKQLADQQKRILDAQKTEAEVAQGKVPTIKTVGGQELQYDAATGKWIVPPQAAPADPNAPPNVNLTEPQAKALTFHSWAKQGNAGLVGNDQLLAHGLQQELLGKVPYFGNQAQNDQYRRARNAANNFVLAFMRDTSGAAYGAKEMYDHASALLPKLGDDPKTLADKASMRQSFVDTLYGGLGPGRQIADFYDKKHAAAAQDKQSAIDSEMAGITPKGIGDTKHNVKTGAVRVWNGKNWVEK